MEIFQGIDVPQFILTDGGKEFANSLLEVLSASMGAVLHHTTPYHPQCNGLTEVCNKILVGAIRKYGDAEQVGWPMFLNFAVRQYNAAPQANMGWLSPFQVLYARASRAVTVPVGRCGSGVIMRTL